MTKIKFEFNQLQKTLYIHQPGSPRQLITKTFTTNWGSPGFILEPNNHWITFTIYPTKIRAFYKCVEELENWPSDLPWESKSVSAETLTPLVQSVTYYLKDLELAPASNSPITFTFTTQDRVEKLHGQWTKKHA